MNYIELLSSSAKTAGNCACMGIDPDYAALPEGVEVSDFFLALFEEMDAQQTLESKVYKALDKLEALIQHNESPIDTWSENEYELNKTYAFDAVAFSDWLTSLRQEVLKDTLEKIETES